ncbi:hypothetical protein CBL_10585 [Carabus blaptoides fortunei]
MKELHEVYTRAGIISILLSLAESPSLTSVRICASTELTPCGESSNRFTVHQDECTIPLLILLQWAEYTFPAATVPAGAAEHGWTGPWIGLGEAGKSGTTLAIQGAASLNYLH